MLCMRRQQAYGRLQLVPNNLNGFVRLFAYTVRAVPEFDQFPLTIRHDAICPSVRFFTVTVRSAEPIVYLRTGVCQQVPAKKSRARC